MSPVKYTVETPAAGVIAADDFAAGVFSPALAFAAQPESAVITMNESPKTSAAVLVKIRFLFIIKPSAAFPGAAQPYG
jgi:hypothetical protein